MEFRILGPLEVVDGGQTVELGGHKQRALLAVLLLEANQVVSSDRLIDMLWDGQPPATARKALYVYVSELRKALGRERVETRSSGYLLRVGEDESDLERFQCLREEGKLAEALSLWRGIPLSDFRYQRFAQPEIARLEEARLACLEDRIEADLAAGRHGDLVSELGALVREHPLRQRLRAQLMRALYRSGRDSEALEVYQETRRALVEELGIEPGRQMRELHQQILNQDAALELPTASEDPVEPSRGVFVGRERELDQLVSALDDAVAWRGRLVLLAGEPGIGKSRLADELIHEARRRGVQVLVGRCWEAGGAPAYWPWVQSLRAYIREVEPETLRVQLGAGATNLAQILPELHEFFPGLGEPFPMEPESARFQLFDAATTFLVAASWAQPLVLVLDDLHAADESSLLLLRFLARGLHDSRLLVIGAYRDVDPTPSPSLSDTVAELSREAVTSALTLAGLGEEDVRAFVKAVAGEEPNEGLVVAIHGDTEGNPLFVGEMVRLLATEGSLDGEPQRPAIPQSVRDAIARRLAHLSEDCNRILVLASILGREFDLAVTAQIADVTEDRLLDTLDEAMEVRVVSDIPGIRGRLRFAHVLMRDTLYEGLTTARQIRLHRQVVAVLEHGDAASNAELAYHAIAGGAFDKGLFYARRAADSALEVLAYEDAERLYEMALDALELADPHDDRMRCELMLSLGEAQTRAGNTPTAKETFLSAASLARELGLGHELARAAAGYGGRVIWARAGNDDRLVPLIEEALSMIGDEDVVLRAWLLARLGGALRDEHSRERRDQLSAAAVALARSSGNAAALDFALEGRAHAILGPDTIAEQLEIGAELQEVIPPEDRERRVAVHMMRDIADLLLGDVRGDEVRLEVVLRIAEELREPTQLWVVIASKAVLATATGRLTEADELTARAFELGQHAIPEVAKQHFHTQRYALASFRGGLEDVEPAIRELAAAQLARPLFRCMLVRLHAQLGKVEEAKIGLLELAADDAALLPFDEEWLLGMAHLADACAMLRDVETASSLYKLLLPWHELNAVDPTEGFLGSVSRYLGLLAALLERPEDTAARHFEDAIAMNERMGARPWRAYAQQDYARLLERSDPDRAEALLAAARATYREIGMIEPA
jgi:DNA-binding SARP family transcriptional activator